MVAMPLEKFGREGDFLEFRVPWLQGTLWFVPEERHAETLGREGREPRTRVDDRGIVARHVYDERQGRCHVDDPDHKDNAGR